MTTTDPTESVRGAIRAARVGDPAPAINLDTLGPTDSELESPTPLAEQIAREHHLAMVVEHEGTGPVRLGCSCGLVSTGAKRDAHIATVTEQAVRERVAEGIEAAKSSHAFRNAVLDRAARIARGEGS